MLYKFVGRNMEVSQRLKTISEKKLERLSKFFSEGTTAVVTFKEEGYVYRVEVTIPVKGTIIRAEVSAEDPYTGIDDVMDKLDRQISKYKARLAYKAKSDQSLREDYFAADAEVSDDTEKYVIVRTKTVEAELMDEEEAVLQLELSGHDFFIFKNSATNKVSVLYKRHLENTYGLINVQ